MDRPPETEEMDLDEVEEKFQKPNKYLKVLPIPADVLERDADNFYKQVKDKLTSAVLLQDIKQGARFWSQQFLRLVVYCIASTSFT